MSTKMHENLKKLIIDCKSELLNHTLQDEIVSPYIKKINSNLDSCLDILKNDWARQDRPIAGTRNPRVTGDSRNHILFFAYCMAKWDTEFANAIIGRIFNQTEAFEYLADVLKVKVATLRNYRDTFDSHVEQMRSNRQGWKKALNAEFQNTIARYDGKSEQELIDIGKEIISKATNSNEFNKINQEEISLETHKIISVEIVPGDSLDSRWRDDMQQIITDKGTYIDNVEGAQFGFFKEAKPGLDWSSKIGQTIEGIKIFKYKNYMWLNKQ